MMIRSLPNKILLKHQIPNLTVIKMLIKVKQIVNYNKAEL
jgi:hypothetical protein